MRRSSWLYFTSLDAENPLGPARWRGGGVPTPCRCRDSPYWPPEAACPGALRRPGVLPRYLTRQYSNITVRSLCVIGSKRRAGRGHIENIPFWDESGSSGFREETA